ncbi:putative O-phosphoseryl-tRNA(Sec) kinase [Paratrimastix pyriformis]|uniref:O-phosphoseryl-tRNA(Sec) kinase n=1 Tax=Paratrimastix pyriformis TaxID=342808 RepID=A0ABQ8UWK4_9EUKA|nr:putative O-phosphoseryl-tRNA(Sec) kinase [Paratrimastix pyriformis]
MNKAEARCRFGKDPFLKEVRVNSAFRERVNTRCPSAADSSSIRAYSGGDVQLRIESLVLRVEGTIPLALSQMSVNSTTRVFHYDDELPAVDASDEFHPDEWKESRARVFQQVESCIQKLREENAMNPILFIDDNMYYASMRQPYLHLARKYSYGLLTIHCDCSVDTALQRNAGRPAATRVPDRVIRQMAARLEPPHQGEDPSRSGFVAQVGPTAADVDPALFERALRTPIRDYVALEEETRASSRAETEASVRHQVDIATRQALAALLGSLKGLAGAAPGVDALSSWAKSLNTLRRAFLDKLSLPARGPQDLAAIVERQRAGFLAECRQALPAQLAGRVCAEGLPLVVGIDGPTCSGSTTDHAAQPIHQHAAIPHPQKSTLALQLLERASARWPGRPVRLFAMDRFYREPAAIPVVALTTPAGQAERPDYDRPQALDLDQMARQLRACIDALAAAGPQPPPQQEQGAPNSGSTSRPSGEPGAPSAEGGGDTGSPVEGGAPLVVVEGFLLLSHPELARLCTVRLHLCACEGCLWARRQRRLDACCGDEDEADGHDPEGGWAGCPDGAPYWEQVALPALRAHEGRVGAGYRLTRVGPDPPPGHCMPHDQAAPPPLDPAASGAEAGAPRPEVLVLNTCQGALPPDLLLDRVAQLCGL